MQSGVRISPGRAKFFLHSSRSLAIAVVDERKSSIKFGVKCHRPRTQGSDGKLGNDFVEVKTISPEKSAQRIAVKRAGNFNKLLVVRISEEFEFEARLIDRKALGKGRGKRARYTWVGKPDRGPKE